MVLRHFESFAAFAEQQHTPHTFPGMEVAHVETEDKVTIVTLISCDKQQFTISRELANEFPWVKHMLEDLPDSDEPIPLTDASCDAHTVERILKFQQRQMDVAKNVETKQSALEKEKEDQTFIASLTNKELDQIVCAANFLDLQHLLKIASLQIKRVFVAAFTRLLAGRNIEDMTPEECFAIICELHCEFSSTDDQQDRSRPWYTDEERQRMVVEWGHMIQAYKDAKKDE